MPSRRTSVIPRAYGISTQTINDIDNLIRQCQGNLRNFNRYMNVLVEIAAKTHQGFAEKKSRGIVDPSMKAGRPWTIPVRRILGNYYYGWKVQQVRPGAWRLTNLSREAAPIEFGVNPQAIGARPRPVVRLSAVETITFLQRTNIIDRISHETILNLHKRAWSAYGRNPEGLALAGPPLQGQIMRTDRGRRP